MRGVTWDNVASLYLFCKLSIVVIWQRPDWCVSKHVRVQFSYSQENSSLSNNVLWIEESVSGLLAKSNCISSIRLLSHAVQRYYYYYVSLIIIEISSTMFWNCSCFLLASSLRHRRHLLLLLIVVHTDTLLRHSTSINSICIFQMDIFRAIVKWHLSCLVKQLKLSE